MLPLDEEGLRALFNVRAGPGERLLDRAARAWFRTLARLRRFGGVSAGNTITLYYDGDAAFTAMLDAIAGARVRVWLETYIFADDPLGQRVRDALAAAAARGVDVVVLYDQFGSSSLPDDFFVDVKAKGGRVVSFNPIFSFRRRNPLVLRDHRKILVVDDDVGFCGGMNVSADYAGAALGTGRFRDTHARVKGPGARELARIFTESVARASDVTLSAPPPAPAPDVDGVGEGTLVQVLRAEPFTTRRQIQHAVRYAVSRAVFFCALTSPYFVPPRALVRALRAAARRGVDVRVLTAGKSDVPLVRYASWHLYGRLVRAGVRIFELESRTLHAKTAVVDGVYGTVGSFNLDLWSHNRLLEVNLGFIDRALASSLEEQFKKDLEGAREITGAMLAERTLGFRVLSWLASLVVRL